MIIMSIDYGDVRTGVAICDCLETFAHPLTVINQSYQPKLINSICELVKENKPELIVVGLPKNMDSTQGDRSEKCLQFAKLLSDASGIKTVMWDERLTTVEAHKFLNYTDTRGKKRKNVVDAVAATIILQDYLDFRRNCKK